MKANLGDKVKDRVTGFTGIVTSISHYLNGCIRCGVQPEVLEKDGKYPEALNIDIEQLEVLKPAYVVLEAATPSGANDDPVNGMSMHGQLRRVN
jgi:hypothetical protein